MLDPEVRITLRMPESLRDRLLRASEMNNRSMNGEIVDRLDWTFERSTAEMQSLLDEQKRLSEAFQRQQELLATHKSLEQTSKSIIAFYENALRMLSQRALSVSGIPEDLRAGFEAWASHKGAVSPEEADKILLEIIKDAAPPRDE